MKAHVLKRVHFRKKRGSSNMLFQRSRLPEWQAGGGRNVDVSDALRNLPFSAALGRFRKVIISLFAAKSSLTSLHYTKTLKDR